MTIGWVRAEDGYSFSLHRIFLGDHPIVFYVEIALRSAVIFAAALLFLRLSGKRSLGQLSPVDLLIIIALGSAVGDPMLYDDVPVIEGLAVVAVVCVITFVVARVGHRSPSFERVVDSHPVILVEQGAIDEEALLRESISRRELLELLRQHHVVHLDDVYLAILEPSGSLSVLTMDQIHDGQPSAEIWRPESPVSRSPSADR